MTALRWILLVAGFVVMAAIYLLGRRNRGAPGHDTPPTFQESYVPQLDQPVGQSVRTRVREVEQRVTISDGDAAVDDLPPMHADTSFADASLGAPMSASTSAQRHAPQSTAYEPIFQESPSNMTTGAFIAAQAHAEPITRKLDDAAPVAKPKPEQAAPRPARKTAGRKIVALRLSTGSERVEGARLKSLLEAAGLRHGKYSIYHRLNADDSPLFSVASMVEPGTFDPYAMSGVQFPGVTIFMQLPGAIDGDELFTQMLACARELEQGIGGLLQDERGQPLTEQRAQRLREDVANFMHLLGQP